MLLMCQRDSKLAELCQHPSSSVPADHQQVAELTQKVDHVLERQVQIEQNLEALTGKAGVPSVVDALKR